MLKYIYLIIKARLEAEIASLPVVAWYNNQYNQDDPEALFAVPAVYIEFLPVPLTDYGRRIQGGDVTFRIHLVTEYYDDDDETLAHFDLSNDIFATLDDMEGWASELPQFAALLGTDDDYLFLNQVSRTQIVPDHAQTNLVVTIQEFKALAIDLSNMRTWVETPATLDITAIVTDQI